LASKRPEAAKYLMQETVRFAGLTIRDVMDKAALPLECIDVIASVQPRGWVPEAIARHLGLPKAAGVSTYAEYAHLGACGPVVNWVHAIAQGRLKPGGHVALYAQGAGFTRAAGLVQMASE
jgi:3-oxoacyl-[acyl-carrier-protein] synthase III